MNYTEIYELDPGHFFSATGLAWQVCLKTTGVELELLTNNDILMMIEKGIRGGICRAIYSYAKANNDYLKNYNKSIEFPYLMYLDANNLCRLAMFQKFTVNGFRWKKMYLNLMKILKKNYDEDSNKGYILEVDVE